MERATAMATIAFTFLFVVYVGQAVFASLSALKIRYPDNKTLAEKMSSQAETIWKYFVFSFVGPILLGFLPDLFGDGCVIREPAPLFTEIQCSSQALAFYIGVRLMISYLLVAVILDISLYVQGDQSSQRNPWSSFILANLLVDISSLIVLDLVKIQSPSTGDSYLLLGFFILCSMATIAASLFLVLGFYLMIIFPGAKAP